MPLLCLPPLFSLILLLPPLLAVLLISPTHKKNKPTLYEFSSRDEMVHLAGYGEEKLSTILVTGTVLYEACLTAVVAI
ncbi:hypothetical protein Goari_020636 [Gossypium aridum]|uniref:Uncharacterized protein n=1 Tax=Gossypium aridum TaxID=34290 RepID=A0A7J8YU95_GOSAI|nr:hypothetical protein [Gossypium aridum]